MRVLIYGAGSVGLGVASCLIKAGQQVDLMGRPATQELLRKKGFIREGIFGNFHALPDQFGSYTSLNQIPDKWLYDFIFVCTKSNDSKPAALDISEQSKLLKSDGKIILFQNGWGNAEIFIEYFPKETVYNARVITGFIRPELNKVNITVHADAIHIGNLFGSSIESIVNICNTIQNGGIPCETTLHIGKDLWAKMLYNCALNPLGAILDVPYGNLAKHKQTRFLMNQIIDEVFQVMTISGYSTHWPDAETYRKVFYEELIPATALHHSSTLQDVKAGRLTEIEALTGAIIRLAEKNKFVVPYNRTVYSLIKFIESRSTDS